MDDEPKRLEDGPDTLAARAQETARLLIGKSEARAPLLPRLVVHRLGVYRGQRV